MKIQILLADDHRMFRQGLRTLLKTEPDLEVISEADDGRAAVEMVRELNPDVVVMDITMPDLNGIEATKQILIHNPNVRVIALTAQANHHAATEILRAGAAGFVLKESAFDELARAIRTVVSGKPYLSPPITALMSGGAPTAFSPPMVDLPISPRLTAREREVLQLMSEGKATKEIALSLKVSVKTVETHRRQIMAKLNLDNVAELTKYAIREGITSLDF